MSINKPYRGPQDLPQVIPVFALNGALLLPLGQLPLNIFEPRYMAMIDDAMKTDRIIGMVQVLSDAPEKGGKPALYGMGCAGRITSLEESGDGRYVITLTGVARYRILEELSTVTPYRQARVDFSPFVQDFEESGDHDDVDRDGVIRALRRFAEVHRLFRGLGGHRCGAERSPGQCARHDESFRPEGEAGPARSARLEGACRCSDRHRRDGSCAGRCAVDPAMIEAAFVGSSDVQGPAKKSFPMASTTDTPAFAVPVVSGGVTAVDRRLLEILVCPVTKAGLIYDAARQELISETAKLAYPIRDGIPIMLPEEARIIEG